jgi:hypothetical protein
VQILEDEETEIYERVYIVNKTGMRNTASRKV